MKLYGLLVVQNEADIIEDVLEFLQELKIYETIFFFDLGSHDGTLEKARQFKDLLHEPQLLNSPYTEKLRFDLLENHRSFLREGDWLAIVDADEFYAENPLPFIQLAETELASCIQTYQAEFMFTDIDLRNFKNEDQNLPIYERRKYYLIDWSEIRFYKFLPNDGFIRGDRPCSKRMLNRHYQFRTPDQIKVRIQTRLENRNKTQKLRGRNEWPQIYSKNWEDYVVPQRTMHQVGSEDGFRFGIPAGIRWKDYYSKNPFSPLIPEIATTFDKAQNNAMADLEYKFDKKVSEQLRDDLSDFNWIEAVDGLSVLIRYRVRHILKQSLKKIGLRGRIVWNAFQNALRSATRVLTGHSTGSISAHPNPIEISNNSGVGSTRLKWRSFRADNVEIHIDAPDGQIFDASAPNGAKVTGDWVSDGTIFYLQDVSRDMPLISQNTLARIVVRVVQGKKIAI